MKNAVCNQEIMASLEQTELFLDVGLFLDVLQTADLNGVLPTPIWREAEVKECCGRSAETLLVIVMHLSAIRCIKIHYLTEGLQEIINIDRGLSVLRMFSMRSSNV